MRLRLGTSLVCLMVGMAGCSGSGTSTITNGNTSASPASNATSGGGEPTTATSNDVSQTNANVQDRLNRKRRLPVSGPPGPEVPLDFRPGPENSETATTMNAQGQPVEVRVFKDNPQLARVEAVWLGANDKLLKITLRDGTTVEVRTDRIANLSSAPSELLVELAGGSK